MCRTQGLGTKTHHIHEGVHNFCTNSMEINEHKWESMNIKENHAKINQHHLTLDEHQSEVNDNH